MRIAVLIFEVVLVTGGLDNTDVEFLYFTSTEVLYPGAQAWVQVGDLPRPYSGLRVGSSSLAAASRVVMKCKIYSRLFAQST